VGIPIIQLLFCFNQLGFQKIRFVKEKTKLALQQSLMTEQTHIDPKKSSLVKLVIHIKPNQLKENQLVQLKNTFSIQQQQKLTHKARTRNIRPINLCTNQTHPYKA
jgi:hypothetical protein